MHWYLTAAEREELALHLRAFCTTDSAWKGFLDDVETTIRWYKQIKEVANKSSAASVRANLKAAKDAADRLLKRISDLDGNSRALLRATFRDGSFDKAAQEVRAAIVRASLKWEEDYPPRQGPRSRPERVQAAAVLLAALRRHTMVEPTTTEGKPFEKLLKLAFGFAGERHKDLHRLAGRALAGVVTVEQEGGLLSVSAPNDE